ncbi:uncharacterized protein LOC122264410 [Penaeus japonicus]|uniref:uncharacterized protein LOC122264410 n=1 Tax=Penaeus japonicus TaxID=27405 RepID=UPI001C710F5A|nr:uncharacterized protein LOC122264410 [Penaeus japonicus]
MTNGKSTRELYRYVCNRACAHLITPTLSYPTYLTHEQEYKPHNHLDFSRVSFSSRCSVAVPCPTPLSSSTWSSLVTRHGSSECQGMGTHPRQRPARVASRLPEAEQGQHEEQ